MPSQGTVNGVPHGQTVTSAQMCWHVPHVCVTWHKAIKKNKNAFSQNFILKTSFAPVLYHHFTEMLQRKLKFIPDIFNNMYLKCIIKWISCSRTWTRTLRSFLVLFFFVLFCFIRHQCNCSSLLTITAQVLASSILFVHHWNHNSQIQTLKRAIKVLTLLTHKPTPLHVSALPRSVIISVVVFL